MDVVYIGGETLAEGSRYLHHADVLRATPYAAFGGQEGVIGSGDLKVVEGATPGGFVNVQPGVVAVLGRGSAQSYEMYVAKSEIQESVSVTATDSSGSRSDLVIIRVVDPEDGPSGDTAPSDTVNGPYAFPEIIEGVDPSTTSLADTFAVHGVKAGFALARLDIPASTATITNSEIVGLRKLASPLSRYIQRSVTGPATIEEIALGTGYQQVPSTGTITVRVPPYATTMDVDITHKPMRLNDPAAGTSNRVWGLSSFRINGGSVFAGSWYNHYFDGPFSELWTGTALEVDVTSFQGQDITIDVMQSVEGVENAPNAVLQATSDTSTVFRINFGQQAI